MSTEIYSLIKAAYQGDWSPLIEESRKAPGKHWAEEARCANQDIDIFVPLGDGPREDPEIVKDKLGISLNRPRNLCASCPLAVAARCLVESLRDDDEFGIRAGLLASERSTIRTAWQQRANEEAVQGALQGSTAALSKVEREAVIARFAADPSEPAAVARGLGVTHEYLLKLARRHRKKSQSTPAAPQPAYSADAA
ncbi:MULTISPECIES: WhiB family transcriptional regulator [unclassified Streptomyces]|uniref:WhiB family transcriptional regulator n=1 Tax=unclassified Streptomyces TaxID=2593676 RepID=UPI001BE60CB2|nr:MULTISPECIES: WhiB family transcriptional regulator [unclassified Streptomyces]MBT2405563.1 WhiB family transcriptional regulator [Streptomyces sp. ISL-21]MBT2607757.1 WhiB family transcriptional regulator [Streptomyces sp. ISL-87]